MTKTVAIVVALVAPLLFPAFLAAFFVLGAAIALPPLGLLGGILTDAVYRTPNAFPYATLLGFIFMFIGYGVQHLIKTRIMG